MDYHSRTMPIPLAQLHEAQTALDERVLKHLQNHPGEAFSLVEIYAAVEHVAEKYKMDFAQAAAMMQFTFALMPAPEKTRTLAPVMTALSALVRENKIIQGKVGGIEYYAVDK
jgi:hypothetical protein